jgi:hypothetical protein
MKLNNGKYRLQFITDRWATTYHLGVELWVPNYTHPSLFTFRLCLWNRTFEVSLINKRMHENSSEKLRG